MRYLALIFIFICYSLQNNVIAVNNSLDSLRLHVRQMPDDTLKVYKLKEIADKYIQYQRDTALVIIKDAIKLAEKNNYKKAAAECYYILGKVYKYRGNYDLSIVAYNSVMKLSKETGDSLLLSKSLNGLGNILKRQGEFSRSLEIFNEGLAIARLIEDTLMLSAFYNNMGVLYYDMGYYNQSIEHYKQYLELKKKNNQVKGIHTLLMNIGNAYLAMSDYEMAMYYYKQAMEKLGESDNNYDRLLLIHNLGIVYEETGKYNDAIKYYSDAIILEKEIGEKEMLVYSLQGLGNSYHKLGNISKAKKYLEESYALANEIRDIRKQHKLSKNLYLFYESLGDYKKSFMYMKDYIFIEDSIYNLDKRKQMLALEQKYKAEQREQQIAYLEKEHEIQKLELSKSTLEAKQKSIQRNILIVFFIIALGITLYLALESKKRKRLNKILVYQNKKINEQRTEIVSQNEKLLESNKIKDKLFQIIAHDLRSPIVSMDSITQLIPYWIEEQDYDSLSRLSKTLELSVNSVLSLIDNLLNWALSQQGKFPFQPEKLNLNDNILETVEIYHQIAKLKNITLEFKPVEDIAVFADRNMLFTVMRNLINNAVKFTPEKGKITVGIEKNMQVAKVWVKDTGVGIAKEKQELVFEMANGSSSGTSGETGKGLGLFFCKEFVNMNQGDIYIESKTGKGTTISFTVPLFNNTEN